MVHLKRILIIIYVMSRRSPTTSRRFVLRAELPPPFGLPSIAGVVQNAQNRVGATLAWPVAAALLVQRIMPNYRRLNQEQPAWSHQR